MSGSFLGGGRGAAGAASVKSCQKFPTCLTEPKPDGSKANLALAKAEAISDGITCLRREKVTVQH